MTENLEGQVSWSDQDTWCGKTWSEHCLRQAEDTQEKTSKPSSRRSSALPIRTLPTCLCLVKESGASQDAYTIRWENGQLLGGFSTRSFGEQPNTLMDECGIEEHHNGVAVSHLSQILEDSPPLKYSLSKKACQGIISRAERRGKKLPPILKEALENQIEELHDED